MEHNRHKMTQLEAEMLADQYIKLLPAFVQLAPYQSKLLKTKYDALVKEGFSPQQAMQIVITRPMVE